MKNGFSKYHKIWILSPFIHIINRHSFWTTVWNTYFNIHIQSDILSYKSPQKIDLKGWRRKTFFAKWNNLSNADFSPEVFLYCQKGLNLKSIHYNWREKCHLFIHSVWSLVVIRPYSIPSISANILTLLFLLVSLILKLPYNNTIEVLYFNPRFYLSFMKNKSINCRLFSFRKLSFKYFPFENDTLTE